MTRTPLSISRVTWLMRSIFFCIDMKSGMARVITRPMKTPMTGMATRITARERHVEAQRHDDAADGHHAAPR